MNMLIGILCTVVSGAYEQAKADAWQLELEARADRTLEMLNVRKTGQFSKTDLDRMIKNPGDFWELHELGVDLVALWNDANIFVTDHDDGDMSWDDFKDLLISQGHAGRAISISDLIEQRQVLMMEVERAAGPR